MKFYLQLNITLLILLLGFNNLEAQQKTLNHLTEEASPYLIRNSTSPVNWYPWGDEALNLAGAENKLMIISIGYSSCHWCHVMEDECFSDSTVASYMNQNFVCIKVDREERPDIDQLYSQAVQWWTGKSGWPMNAVAMPDGMPIGGGTYFTAEEWMDYLTTLNLKWTENPHSINDITGQLLPVIRSNGLSENGGITQNPGGGDFEKAMHNLAGTADTLNGGFGDAPKFPFPAALTLCLTDYGLTKNNESLELIEKTLESISRSAIRDQLGNGFARYASDVGWTEPHFEKMLYTNASFASVYTKAYQATRKADYKSQAYSALLFIEEELSAPGGAFYSSMDSDSEGEEGKYYCWNKHQFQQLLGEDAALMISYYHLRERDETGIALYVDTNQFARRTQFNISEEEYNQRILAAEKKLMKARNNRAKPNVDEKIITGWNAMAIKAYAEAYRVFGDKKFLSRALNTAKFIEKRMYQPGGALYRVYTKKGASGDGYLEDYAFLAEAYISLYQATFDEQWLVSARNLVEYVNQHFSSEQDQLFYVSSDLVPELLARKIEYTDGEIQSANGVMAHNLFALSIYFENSDYTTKARAMYMAVHDQAIEGGRFFATWNLLLPWLLKEPSLLAIGGSDQKEQRNLLDRHFLPGVLLCGATQNTVLPVLKDKSPKGSTAFYLCRERTCRLPVESVEEVLKQLQE